ncbi:hypothetical protein [Clostridium sp.]
MRKIFKICSFLLFTVSIIGAGILSNCNGLDQPGPIGMDTKTITQNI